MILNQAQAEAVYSAMCALNNVGGKISATIDIADGFSIVIKEGVLGNIRVQTYPTASSETYSTQASFAANYNL